MNTNQEPQRPAAPSQPQPQSLQPGYPAANYQAQQPVRQPAQTYYPPQPLPLPQPQDPRKVQRRMRRRMVNRPVGLTLAYEVVMNIGAAVVALTIVIVTMAERSELTNLMVIRHTGIMMLIAVTCAIVFLLFMRRKDILTREFWLGGPHRDNYGEPWQIGRVSRYGGAHMKPLWLLVFLTLCLGIQGVVTLVQFGFSAIGLSLPSPTSESITESAVTVSMWLYIGLIGPIFEEVLFRGVLLKELKPFGRNFAIVTSALLFGLFHGDVVQGAFAFLMGLLLGFVAMEYSLVWAIAIHIFNNAILSGVVDGLASHYLNDNGYLAYSLILSLIGVVGTIIAFVLYGRGLKDYVRVNRSASGTYLGWTSWTFIVFVAGNALTAIVSFIGALMG
ncbi:CPBP family intramembrane metalloprotease domain-containing protein [Bifidobacterium callitrichos]|uniref:CPBP family intramembrane metalloprotease domain-containing protein n=1 Tax=Bifidobacterium callitrichos TaxID=762209 RepID=A0A2T3G7X5_9BIFI|nr:CPBP family intramembrane glutamic endopeptidase [Bifidobacterium callitrichos]PST45562.1 CPBP family intramembrane metalloprotease domain-containing protein [Bifidobacterium callitrichos]